MLRKVLFFTIVFVFLFSLVTSAQGVDEVIKKYVEARGGHKNLKAVKTIKMTGKYLTQGIEATFLYRAKRPNFLRIEITLQGQSIIQAYDGKTDWWVFPFQGITEPQAMPEDRAKDFIARTDMDGALVDYKKKGHTVELIGKEDVEGTAAYKLKVTLKNGRVWYVYLDTENYLELKIYATIKRQGAEYEVHSYSGNYKKINGVMFPHSLEDKIGDVTNEQVVIEKIELNTDMDDAIFKMPEKK
ncbi:MAG: hypothetical protein KAT34_19570 [Candidatus Aminicenantes bacterium]|nr:hypothetical protein [Candidatus Aminicenantes bacterium]